MTLRALWAEGPMLLAALLVQALPGAAGQVATVGALLLLAFRLIWRALRSEAPPWMPGAAFLAFMIRVALALGVWVMLGSLAFVGLELLWPGRLALIGAGLIATPLTLALAVPGLPPPVLSPPVLSPPVLPPSVLPEFAPRPGLLAALTPAALPRTGLWLGLGVLPVCGLALALWLFLPGPLAVLARTGAVVVTSLTLAHLWRGLAPPKPGAAVFA